MLTLNKLDTAEAHILHQKLSRMWREADEAMARRAYRMMSRIYLHIHKTMLRSA
ncbi:hypothetical protein [Bradyrhizobium phage BDU-MI-1]|nr:hypothetical protein [Bradyrhizobium phage BDU-MI-1]